MAKKNTVTVTFLGDDADLSRTFDSVTKDSKKFEVVVERTSSSFSSNVKGAFAGVGVASVGAFGKSMFHLGADLESQSQKTKIVFGDQIGVVQSWAQENANAMGLTRSEAAFTAAGIADLLKPMGFTSEAAALQSTKLLDLAGALSVWSGNTKTAQEVSEILTGAVLGEYDSLKSLGISLSAAEVEQRLVEKGQKDLTGAALQQAEALIVQELLIGKSTDALTNYNDATRTTNERIAEQSAKFDELKEKVGSFVHGELNDYANWATSGDGKGVTGWWADYNLGVDVVWMKTEGFVDALVDFKDTVHGFFFSIDDWFADLGDKLTPFDNLGFDLRMPSLPRFHSGGVVPGPVGSEVPIIAQAGERVLPIGASGSRASGGVSVTVPVILPNWIGGDLPRDAIDQIKRGLEDMFARGESLSDGRGGVLRPSAA